MTEEDLVYIMNQKYKGGTKKRETKSKCSY